MSPYEKGKMQRVNMTLSEQTRKNLKTAMFMTGSETYEDVMTILLKGYSEIQSKIKNQEV